MKVNVKRRITGPDAPALGPVLTISSSALTLTLDRPASGPTRIDRYEIERLSGATWTQIASGLTIFSASGEYPDTGLSSSTAYQYRCRAVDTTERVSEWSYASGTTSAGVTNTAPVWDSTVAITLQAGSSVSIASYCSDPQGDQVTFSKVSASPGNASITVSASGVVQTASDDAGSYTLTVRASDGALTADKAIALTVSAPSTGTNWDIASGVAVYNAASVQAGDTITILRGTGTRGPLEIQNVAGALGNQIRIIPDPAGRVTIRRSAPGGGGSVFKLTNCHHFTLDGYRAGATRDCGIRVMYATGSTTSNKDLFNNLIGFGATSTNASTLTDDCTISYIELDGGWTLATPLSSPDVGVGIFTNLNAFSRTAFSGQYQENIVIERCYVHNLGTEGIYNGPNWSNGHVPLRNITIRYNYVEDCGYSGINGKLWISGTNAIHNNTVINCGSNPTSVAGQFTGIALLSGTASVYNNYVSGCGECGLKVYNLNGPPKTGSVTGYGSFPTLDAYFYNNVAVNSGGMQTVSGGGAAAIGHGISFGGDGTASEPTGYAYNNTCVNNEGDGVNYNNNCSGGWARNNILLGNRAATALGSGGATQANNLTTGTVATVFVAPESANYHLASEQAAVGTPGTDISTTDIEGTSRSGTASKGAYEFA